jgi:hypothetical protein
MVGLEIQAGVVGTTIVHEPDGHGLRRRQRSDVLRNDLSPSLGEPLVPLWDHRTGARHKLHARIPTLTQSLIEAVESHGDEIVECGPCEFSPRLLGELVRDEQSVKPTVRRQTSVAHESAHQNLLLPTRQYVRSEANFPRRYPRRAPDRQNGLWRGRSPIQLV